jgi:hypothetical protein
MMDEKITKVARSGTDIHFHVSPPEDGVTSEVLAVTRNFVNRHDISLKNQQEKLSEIETLLRDWRTQVIGEVGEENWETFRKFSNSQRLSQYGLAEELEYTPDGLAKLKKAKREATERSLAYIRQANLKSETIKEIHRSFANKFDALLQFPESQGERIEMVPERRVPKAILTRTTNPWTVRTAPYDGWAWSYSWHRWGGHDPTLTNYLDSSTGGVGHRSNYQNYSAGDFDGLWLEFDTSVGVWFWTPSGGQVEMWIKARCASCWYNVWLDDEWGWSDSSTWMRNYLTVNVSPAIEDEDRTQAWSSHTWGSPDDTTYGGNVITPNSVIWFHLTTEQPVPANAWSYIKVGTYDRHNSYINDVETNAIMRSRWYFEELQFRVT